MVQMLAPELRVEQELTNYWNTEVVRSPNLVVIGGVTYDAANPSQEDFQVFVDEMVVLSKRLRHPFVSDIIARGAKFVWDAVRLVNVTTRNGYKGVAGRGDALVFMPFELRDTGSAGGFPGTNPRSTWVVNRTATGAARLYPAANTVDMLINSLPVLSHVILGWIDPVSYPKAASVQLVYDDPWPEEFLDWHWREAQAHYETPVYELRQPWIITPGRTYRVNARYDATGQDKLQPIAFTIKRARDLNASTAIAA